MTTAECSPLFGRALSLKLAADGAWEQAFTEILDRIGDRVVDRDRWLMSAGADVALEIGFETDAFVGVRLRPAERARAGPLVAEQLSCLRPRDISGEAKPELTRALGDLRPLDRVGPGLREVMSAIERTTPRFTDAIATRAELGVLDRWQSLGAIDLGPPPWTDLPSTLAAHAAWLAFLTDPLPAPLMLEVMFGPGEDAWLGASVSRSRIMADGVRRHFVEPDTLDRVAASLSSA